MADTCRLAVSRIEYSLSDEAKEESPRLPPNPYNSVDPAPPMAERDPARLKGILLDEGASLFDRYRAMFSLRNVGTEECIRALGEGTRQTDYTKIVRGNLTANSCYAQKRT